MTASELFAPHPGGHCTPPVSPAVAAIRYFRRLVRQWRRKPAAPEVSLSASGAGRTGTALLADRYPCCFHCHAGSPCEPKDNHPKPCAEGCNEVPTGIIRFDGVLSDKMLSEVREQWNAWHDELPGAQYLPRGPRPTFTPSAAMGTGEFAVLDAKVDAVLRPVNGRNLGTQPRRHPELDREFTDRPGPDVLERVIAGLRKLPVYGEKPQVEVDKLYRNGWQ